MGIKKKKLMTVKYCDNISIRKRRQTRCVMVGDVGVGGDNPIRLQSMTTTNTMDTKSTIKQSIRMIEAGCEIVRVTAPSINDAKNLKNIRDGLKSKGFHNPLVADIHFTPNAAKIAESAFPRTSAVPVFPATGESASGKKTPSKFLLLNAS